MSMVKRLVRQLEQRGLSVKPGAEPGQLVLSGPAKEKTPEIIAAVKAFKPQLLELYGVRAAPDLPDEPRGDAVALPETPAGEPAAPQPGVTVCGACKATLYTTNATDVAQTCTASGCPYLTPVRS